ncbi:MAG: transposase [Chloroflexota bacterium]|nr:transposase [Chloroflexota bacterium]
MPTVNTAAMTLVLAAFAADEGIDAMHRVVLVLDGAGWHRAKRLVVPEGIDVVFLPPASPELQPVERVWSLVDEPVANRTFADLNEMTGILVTRCPVLRTARRQIKAHTDIHWWARKRRPRNHQ